MENIHKKVWYAPNRKEAYGQEEIDAVVQCLQDGWLAGFGPKSIEFEQKISERFGKKFGLFVNSGSSAILLGLIGLNLPEQSHVITPACTFSTTVAPIVQLSLVPIFCDIGLNSFVSTVEQVLEKITDLTRVILLPNLVGNKPDWKRLYQELVKINRTDIILFEDSADTITETFETDISTTSFYASHLITAGGSGGMVMFNDRSYFERATCSRDWGRNQFGNSESVSDRFGQSVDGIPYDSKFLYTVPSYNMKSSEMNAAFGLVQLEKFDKVAIHRRNLIERYISNLSQFLSGVKDKPFILPDDSIKPNWLAMPLIVKNRMTLLTHLENNNIQTRVLFAGNVTRHPMYRQYLQPFENSDRVMAEGCLLGAHHGMTFEDVDYVCSKIVEFYSTRPTILDCTFRDGGYTCDWNYSNEQFLDLYKTCNDSGVDYCEIGFVRKPDPKSKFGKWYFCPPELLRDVVAPVKDKTKIAVMCQLGTFDSFDFGPASESCIDMVRVLMAYHTCDKNDETFDYNLFEEGIFIINDLVNKGYEVSFNLGRIDRVPFRHLEHVCRKLNSTGVKVFYIADTYGNLTIQNSKPILNFIKSHLSPNIKIGYHAHDNLSNATSKTLESVNQGCSFIDGTMYGVGRGSGNARTELLVAEYSKNILPMFEYIDKWVCPYKQSSLLYIISGKYSMHINYAIELNEKHSYSVQEAYYILHGIVDSGKHHFYNPIH